MDIDDAIRKYINDLEDTIRQAPRLALEKHNKELIIMLTDDQLLKRGEDSEGVKITPEYTSKTKRIKRSKGQISKHVTWKDSGELHRSTRVVLGLYDFKMSMNAPYLGKLKRKYKQPIIGIQQRNLNKFFTKYLFK